MDWANTTARRGEKHLCFGIGCDLYWRIDGIHTTVSKWLLLRLDRTDDATDCASVLPWSTWLDPLDPAAATIGTAPARGSLECGRYMTGTSIFWTSVPGLVDFLVSLSEDAESDFLMAGADEMVWWVVLALGAFLAFWPRILQGKKE